jgi:teichuronic acid exporter
MQKNSLKSKSINAFIWDLSGNLSNQGISFIISIILARILAPSEFGLIAMINVFFIFSNIFLDLGLVAALIQRKRTLPIHFSSAFYFNLLVGLILSVFAYFSSNLLANFYNQPILSSLTKVMSITFVINAVTIVQDAKLKKSLSFKRIAILKLTANTLAGVVGITMAYNNYGVWSLLTQFLISKLIYTILVWSTVRWIPQLAFSIKALKQLWNFGFRVFVADFINTVLTQIDILIIGRIFPIDSLGYYQRAKSLNRMAIQFSSASLMQVLFPVFSSIQNDLERLKKIILKAMHLLSFVIFFIIGIMYLCSDNIIILLLTKKWLPSIPYFRILLLGGFIYPFSSLFINIIVGRGNSKNHLKLTVLKSIPKILSLAFGFYYGITGFLYCLLISNTINFFLNIYYTKRELQVNYWWLIKPIFPPLILSFTLVLLIQYLLETIPLFNNFSILLIKGFSFTLSFSIIAYVLKFKSLNLIVLEIKSFLHKK